MLLLGLLNLLRSDPLAFVGLLFSLVLALVIAITIHEFTHSLVAYRLGDSTAKRLGRLSPNPLVHLDPLGCLMLFVVGFGWGKPVPVNPYFLRGGARSGMALVSLAGPISNLVVAGIFGLPLKLGLLSLGHAAAHVLVFIVFLNITLGLFNLIPIPPLDGFKVLQGILPARYSYSLDRVGPYGPMILVAVILVDNVAQLGLLWGALRPGLNLLGQLFLGANLV
ncbi:MAG TPA: site-2 protease family protein [Dehalococcoidia bacterium]|jgi:Zn-dependent protease|nr:site-2 protease family protein [Dehalococcoidia bacterium]